MSVSGEDCSVNGGVLDIVLNSTFGVVTEKLFNEFIVFPAFVAQSFAPVMVRGGRDFPHQPPHSFDVFSIVLVIKSTKLSCLVPCLSFLHPPTTKQFFLHPLAEVVWNYFRQVLDDVFRHLGSEVEFAEGERVMDNEAQNRFNRSSRTATEVGQFSDLCNLSTVADFEHVERNHIANELVLQPS